MEKTRKMDGELKKKKKKKKARLTSEDEPEDRISALPDDLIHRILKFVDTRLALQTSVLSKRWKLVWTTLPFLKLKWNQQGSPAKITNLTRHVLKHRNHRSNISSLKLAFLPSGLSATFTEYAIACNLRSLNVQFRPDHKPFKLSKFNSNSIQKLSLRMKLDKFLLPSDCWNLPALTTLHLKHLRESCRYVPELPLTSLPALRTLCLTDWNLESFSLSLPALTTLILSLCHLPNRGWDFPSLKTLMLHDVVFEIPQIIGDILSALASLRSLTLTFNWTSIPPYRLSCPHLVNLEIKTRHYLNSVITNNKLVFLAPKLKNFTCVGLVGIRLHFSKLDNVYIKLQGSTDDKNFPLEKLEQYSQWFETMFSRLGSAKILNLDLETIEVLSSVSNFLASSPSPFYDLKYVKLPHGCKEESISSVLKNYLLGGSPTATIVTALPRDAMIPHTEAASVSAQHAVIEEPLAAPTEVLIDSESSKGSVGVDTVDMGVQEGHVVQNSKVHDDRVIRYVGAPVEGTGNYRVSSSEAVSDIGLWLGHEVKSEFVCLLDHIMNKYPETFDHFATKNKEFCTMKLNMLCTTVNNFTKIFMTEVDTEMISEYRDVFTGLQNFGFNISWLVSRLNYVEQLRFSQPLLPELHAIDRHINDTKRELHDLQFRIEETKIKLQNLLTLRAEKMQEIQKAFGTMGTNLAIGYIGDYLLLPGP